MGGRALIAAGLALGAVGVLGLPAADAAPTFTVTTTADSAASAPCTASSCSLRSAIAQANLPANAGATVTIPQSSSPYLLTHADGGELEITQSMTLKGAGQAATVIHGDGVDRVLDIAPGAGATVTVEDLEITGGATSAGNSAEGGGVLINPVDSGVTVVVTDALIDHNSATGLSATSGSGLGGGSAEGGGIDDTAGALMLTGVTVQDNTATGGAGAAITGGDGGYGGSVSGAGVDDGGSSSTIMNSTIAGNVALAGKGGGAGAAHTAGVGGDVFGAGGVVDPTGAMAITDTTVSGNQGTGGAGGDATGSGSTGGEGGCSCGGGLEIETGELAVLTNDTVTGNIATGGAGGAGGTGATAGAATYGAGGGIYINSPVTIEDTTLSANQAVGGSSQAGDGGAIATNGGITGPITLVNSTVVKNTAASTDDPTSGVGGGLAAISRVTVASDTFDGNRAAGSNGGNIFSYTHGYVSAEDTIIAGGNGATGEQNCSTGTVSDLPFGHNLEDDTGDQCGFAAADGDKVGVDPLLAAALASNGGETQTLLPAPTSPARGAGGACLDPTMTGTVRLLVDQRGDPRGASCDIGSVQVQPPANTTPPKVVGSGIFGSSVSCDEGAWTGDGMLAFAIQWLLGGAPIAGASSASLVVPARDLGHQLACRVTVTSGYGSASATSAGLTVSKPAPPKISKLAESAKRWRQANRVATIARKHKTPTGTRFSFKLSEAATVELSFTQGHGKKTKTRGTMSFRGRAGSNTIKFYGRISKHHKLRPGSYTVAVVATAAGGKSARHTLTFTIVR